MTKNPVSSTDNKPPNTSINPDGGVFQVGEKINFSGGKTTDPDWDKIKSFLWDFGDEKTASSMSVSHVYSSPGKYTVVLEATDSHDNSNNAYAIITIQKDTVTTTTGSSGGSTTTGSSGGSTTQSPPQTNIDYFMGDWTGTGFFRDFEMGSGFFNVDYDGTINFRIDGSFTESNSAGKDLLGEGVFRYNERLTPTLTMNNDFFTVVGKSDNFFTILDPLGGEQTKISFSRN